MEVSEECGRYESSVRERLRGRGVDGDRTKCKLISVSAVYLSDDLRQRRAALNSGLITEMALRMRDVDAAREGL